VKTQTNAEDRYKLLEQVWSGVVLDAKSSPAVRVAAFVFLKACDKAWALDKIGNLVSDVINDDRVVLKQIEIIARTLKDLASVSEVDDVTMALVAAKFYLQFCTVAGGRALPAAERAYESLLSVWTTYWDTLGTSMSPPLAFRRHNVHAAAVGGAGVSPVTDDSSDGTNIRVRP
jgi:hypothetical protein